MSFCRLGPDSDVYVYESDRGLECCFCSLRNSSPYKTARGMLKHLAIHRRRGDKVPQDAINMLLNEFAPTVQYGA